MLKEILGGSSLRTRVLRGGSWLAAGNVTEQGLRFARNLVLARILAPEAFGTMAIVLSITSAIGSFTEIGLKEAVIQNPRGSEKGYINTAWWLGFLRAVGLYVFLFASSPLIARFYGTAELKPLLRVTLLSIVLGGAMSSRAFVALKETKFSRWALISHGGATVGILTTVVLAFFIRSAWALAIGFVIENAGRCVLSFLLCPFRPRFVFDKESTRELLRFSRQVLGLPFLNFLFARSDIFVLGKLYSAGELGLYVMAISLAQVPTGFIMNLLSQLLLPTFAEIQDQSARINRLFLRMTTLLATFALPLVAFAFSYGHSLLTTVYGRVYGAVWIPFAIAAAMSMLNMINGQITIVFYSSGSPQLHRRSVSITAVVMLGLVFPFVKMFGVSGGPLAALLAIAIGYSFQIHRLVQVTNLQLLSYFRSFGAGLTGALIVLCLYFSTRGVPFLAKPLPNVMSGLLACAVAYGVTAAGQFLRNGQGVLRLKIPALKA